MPWARIKATASPIVSMALAIMKLAAILMALAYRPYLFADRGEHYLGTGGGRGLACHHNVEFALDRNVRSTEYGSRDIS
jgi:hypothetical protein